MMEWSIVAVGQSVDVFMKYIFSATLLLALAACQQASETGQQDETSAPAPVDIKTVYDNAVQHPARSASDRERDASRKPDQVLEFVGIVPGMRVLDMFSGGGYYTELMAYVVGESGTVVAHSNEAYAAYVGDEALTRYGGDRLPNVQMLMAENNELVLEDSDFDAIMLVLSFHDIYFEDAENGWPRIDGPAFLAELYKGLKPGGVLGIVDHFAAPGSPRETGSTLHRIDPAIVVEETEAAGFVLEETSDVLRNLDDDHTLNMADPAIRGNTDRFVMRFRKPVTPTP